MRGFNAGDEQYEFEGRIEFSTAKAHLVEPTIGKQVWVPKSQITEMIKVEDGEHPLYIFRVTAWWWKKNGGVEP